MNRAEQQKTPVLDIRHLTKSFLMNGSTITVFKDLLFAVNPGELFCITGQSGCGKTTLLKILAGFTPPTAGKALLDGEPITTPGPDRCVVFQEDALFPWLTVKENIAFGLRAQSRKTRKQVGKEVDKFLSMVALSAYKNYLPREISGGMKQRVALARVLILQPKVLLMDEPFAALDALTREKMQDLLLELWQSLKHTIVFVTHDVTEAIALSDRILVMGQHSGTAPEIVDINLERPRKRLEPKFVSLNKKVHTALQPPADKTVSGFPEKRMSQQKA